MSLWIGISIGDVTGIGPEVALKALASAEATDPTRYLLIGDATLLRRLNAQLGLNLPLENFSGKQQSVGFSSASPCRSRCRRTLPPGRRRPRGRLSNG